MTAKKERGVPLGDQLRMVELYEQGQSSNQVADVVMPSGRRWAPRTVRDVLRRRGAAMRTGGETLRGRFRVLPVETDRLVELYRNGHSTDEIAAMFGIHPTSVSKRLQHVGVELRSPNERYALARARKPLDRSGYRRKVLSCLDGKPRTAREVASMTGMGLGAVYDVIPHLERLGLVRRVGMRSRATLWERTGLSFERAYERHAEELLHGPKVNPGKVPEAERLPIEPFRVWVDGLKVRVMVGEKAGGREAVARLLGVDGSRLNKILYQQKYVTLDLADECLTRVNDGTFLWDLWPDRFSDYLEDAA